MAASIRNEVVNCIDTTSSANVTLTSVGLRSDFILQNPQIAWGYGIYSRLMSVVGRTVSGNGDAYAYLPASVNAFHTREGLAELLRQAGLTEISVTDLNLGTVAIHCAVKPDDTMRNL